VKYNTGFKRLLLAALLSTAFVNLSFFAAISGCCKSTGPVIDWLSKPAGYLVQLIPWKTDKQFWILIFLAQYLEYAIVFWGGLSLVSWLRKRKRSGIGV
jgi:hypothetical protein